MPIKTRLKGRNEMAADTMAFHFEKPKGFTHTAGQCGDFTLINPPETDAEGNKRSFTLTSAPYEDDLIITTRMRNTAFKRSLKTVPLGTEIELDAPWGELVLHDDPKVPAVFLTGGIGVTPVRSIVLQATHDKLPHKIFLFYSNRKPEDAAFLDELTSKQKDNPNFTLIATMTKMDGPSQQWSGETGFINKAMIQRSIRDLTLPIYYLTGPPQMVAAMQKTLDEAGVKHDNIRTEEFSGY
jgi:ferredoxin-NADP reductase